MMRYKKLGYVAFNVSDLDRSVAFYRDMVGLDLVETNQHGEAFLSCNSDHHNLVLVQSTAPDKAPSFKRVAFELENEAQLAVAEEWLTKAGVRFARVPQEESCRLRIGAGIRLVDPIGTTVELFVGLMSRPQPFLPHPVHLSHLSHAVMRVAEFQAPHKFYSEVMNFRTSDFRHEPTGERYFAFMRCFPNPYHHSFALQKSDRNAFFHIAFTVKSMDDLMYGKNRMAKAGVLVAPAPGRHMASGSVFQYVADPDGFTVEYTVGMEEFPEVGARQPRMLDKTHRTTDMWEGPPPSNLPAFGDIEPSELFKDPKAVPRAA
jgi:2,3-dihydroxy-p-cumate/2,3-dihydroxybenzoate 3,4-dioxygenase